MKKVTDRKLVEIGKKRVPLRKLIHGKEIRDAAKALEDFRLNFNEQEILLGAKLILKYEPGGDAILYALRPETDKEYNDRLEKARKALEAKMERERIRKLQAEERARKAEENRKANVSKTIKDLIQSNGLDASDLVKILETCR